MRKLKNREAKDLENITDVIGTRARLRIQAVEYSWAGRDEGVAAGCSSRPAGTALTSESQETQAGASLPESCRPLISSKPQCSNL